MSEIVEQPDDIELYWKDKIKEQRNLSYLLSCEEGMRSILTSIKYILFIFVSCAVC